MSIESGKRISTEAQALRTEHERLLAESAKQPGIAEVVKVYGQLAPYAVAPVPVEAKTRYATGGNG